jgi:hypothetical protein
LIGGLENSDENSDCDDCDDNDNNDQHEMTTETTNNSTHRSFFINEKSNSKFYYIRSIDDIKNEIQKNDEDTPGPFYSEKKRYSVQSKSLLNQNSRVS